MSSRYAVIGLGAFGSSVARSLVARGSEVLGIDAQRERVEALRDVLASALILDATDEKAMAAQGLDEFDAVIVSVGERFDHTVLITSILQELGVRRIVARIAREDHGRILRRLGITDVVFPSGDSGERLAHRLRLGRFTDSLPIGDGHSMAGLPVPAHLAGKTLRELNLRAKYRLNLVTVFARADDPRAPRRCIGLPDPDAPLPAGALLYLFGTDADLEAFGK